MNYEDFDDDYEKDFYQEDEDDYSTITCSSCNEQVYEDAIRCPACGDFVIRKHSTWGDKPIWLKVLVLLIIALLVLGFAVGF